MRNTVIPIVVQLEDRRLLSASINGDYFPYLGNYQTLAGSSSTYNCISYTLGDYNTWISQQMGPPKRPLAWMDNLYAGAGFKRLPGMDVSLIPGEKKVVLYGYTNKNGTVTNILHGELQDKDGTWSSKLGDGPLIKYSGFNALSSPAYGHPICVYYTRR